MGHLLSEWNLFAKKGSASTKKGGALSGLCGAEVQATWYRRNHHFFFKFVVFLGHLNSVLHCVTEPTGDRDSASLPVPSLSLVTTQAAGTQAAYRQWQLEPRRPRRPHPDNSRPIRVCCRRVTGSSCVYTAYLK